MSKFNMTGQVAVLSQEDALSARASNAVTNAGYLGGSSWLKSQIDIQRSMYREGLSSVSGYEFVSFNSAKEGMTIPDGAFDFFDLTYDLNLKNVSEALVSFQQKDAAVPAGITNAALPTGTNFSLSSVVPGILSGVNAVSSTTGQAVAFTTSRPGGKTTQGFFIVTNDYKECGIMGTAQVGGSDAASLTPGYKIAGQNPPTDDSGKLYEGIIDLYSTGFPQYKDATDARAGLRYMVGIYNVQSALSNDTDDKYVVKSMSFKADSITGKNQLVLHCRKAAATTNVTINASGTCKGINILKINY